MQLCASNMRVRICAACSVMELMLMFPIETMVNAMQACYNVADSGMHYP